MTDGDLFEQLVQSFIDLHSAQLKTSGVPEHYWPTLFHKIKNEVFDAGEYFQVVMRVDEDDELLGYKAVFSKDSELTLTDPNGIFLIDHAWTYRVNEARQNLREHETLLARMCNIMCVDQDEATTLDEKIDQVIERMWKFNQTYKLSTEKMSDDEREPIWYIMDEFGSSVRHSDTANVNCVPFFYVPTNTMFSILFPNKTLTRGEEIKRDYLYGIKDEKLRKAKLVPWTDYDEDEDEPLDSEPTVQDEPSIEYFMSGRKDETLPSEETQNESNIIHLSSLAVIKVYTDLQSVRESLTDPKYVLVDDMSQADVIFIRKHFKQYKELQESRPSCLVNQFPFENVVTVKDLLAIVSRRVKESQSWLPITYNLSYEMPKFIEYYRQRDKNDLDNIWIMKPWNLARSIDTTVTDNLNQIIRSQETGPKIACKYITNPVLFHRPELNGSVKFDIRYIVLLRSIKPLVIYTYKVFWLRFANKPYSLENFDDYEKHFTVMNYKPSVVLKQIHYNEFIPQFEAQYPGEKWHDGVEKKIFTMIRQVFEGASGEKPPKGIAHNIQSRAMYAVDLMLDWREENGKRTIEPMICEVNFMPDCSRACRYHPDFFNDVFNTLFVDSLSNVTAI